MLSDSQIKALKIEDGKRHADRDGLVLELRPSKKKLIDILPVLKNGDFYGAQATSA
jgi:hypothetical protein